MISSFFGLAMCTSGLSCDGVSALGCWTCGFGGSRGVDALLLMDGVDLVDTISD